MLVQGLGELLTMLTFQTKPLSLGRTSEAAFLVEPAPFSSISVRIALTSTGTNFARAFSGSTLQRQLQMKAIASLDWWITWLATKSTILFRARSYSSGDKEANNGAKAAGSVLTM